MQSEKISPSALPPLSFFPLCSVPAGLCCCCAPNFTFYPIKEKQWTYRECNYHWNVILGRKIGAEGSWSVKFRDEGVFVCCFFFFCCPLLKTLVLVHVPVRTKAQPSWWRASCAVISSSWPMKTTLLLFFSCNCKETGVETGRKCIKPAFRQDGRARFQSRNLSGRVVSRTQTNSSPKNLPREFAV